MDKATTVQPMKTINKLGEEIIELRAQVEAYSDTIVKMWNIVAGLDDDEEAMALCRIIRDESKDVIDTVMNRAING